MALRMDPGVRCHGPGLIVHRLEHRGAGLGCYSLVNIQKTIEHGHLYWIYPLKMVIFHSYVSLPEGNHGI